MTPPISKIITSRLVMRLWKPDDEPLFVEAAAESLEQLRAWLPWARAALQEQWSEMEKYLARPESARDIIFGVFDAAESKVLGGLGMHLRNGDDDREIGYWLRTSAVGAWLYVGRSFRNYRRRLRRLADSHRHHQVPSAKLPECRSAPTTRFRIRRHFSSQHPTA